MANEERANIPEREREGDPPNRDGRFSERSEVEEELRRESGSMDEYENRARARLEILRQLVPSTRNGGGRDLSPAPATLDTVAILDESIAYISSMQQENIELHARGAQPSVQDTLTEVESGALPNARRHLDRMYALLSGMERELRGARATNQNDQGQETRRQNVPEDKEEQGTETGEDTAR